jgi:hypothetical protein
MEDPFLEQIDHDQSNPPMYTRGFVPNIQDSQMELEQFHVAAFHNDNPVVLTMPTVRGTPLSTLVIGLPWMHFLLCFQLARQTLQNIKQQRLQCKNGLHI